MNSPISWIGGKSKLAKDIIRHFPHHRTYIEPFFGAGWVFFKKEPSKIEIINDLNGSLINFWKVVQNKEKLEELKKRLTDHPISEQLFNEYKNNTEWKDDIQQAVEFFFIVKTAFGVRSVTSGRETFKVEVYKNSTFDGFYNINWVEVWRRLRQVQILQRDAIDIIKSYDRDYVLWYLDPPYVVSTEKQDYYKFNDSFIHQRLLNVLKNIKGKFLLSYDYLPEIVDMYSWANIIELKTKYILPFAINCDNTRRERKEYLIANFDISDNTKLNRWF